MLWLLLASLVVLSPDAAPGSSALKPGSTSQKIGAGVIEMPPPIVAARVGTLRPRQGQAVKLGLGDAPVEQQLVELINGLRASQQVPDGSPLPPLKRQALLDQVAEAHALRMATAGFIAHCDPADGSLPGDRLSSAGYLADRAGESLVAGLFDPAAVLDVLLSSPDNRSLLLSPTLREIGIGFVPDPDDQATVDQDLDQDCSTDLTGSGPFYSYWTILVGLRLESFPIVINREADQTSVTTVDLYLCGDGWAEEMMLRNDDGAWTAWLPFVPSQVWALADGPGLRQVSVKIRNAVFVEREAHDTIISTAGRDLIFADGLEHGDSGTWSAAAIVAADEQGTP